MNEFKDDIEKYLKGDLSPTEMHELEKKALHDPFLAEALEGAATINPDLFERDVLSLNRKINTRKTNRYYWPLRIAASILLVALVSYFTIRLSTNELNQPLALQKNTEEKEIQQPAAQDSVEESVTIGDNLLSLKREDKPVEEKPKTKGKSVVQSQPEEIVNAGESEPTVTAEVTKESIADQEVTVEKELAFAADLDESKDDKLTESKTELRRARSETAKKSTSPSALSGSGRDQQSTGELTTNPAKPSIDDASLQEYLKSNLKYPKEAADNKIEGEVIIGFIVNKDGKLSDFSVEKSIGFGCDEELIRLIKEGPSWTPAMNNGKHGKQKTSFSYSFVLPK